MEASDRQRTAATWLHREINVVRNNVWDPHRGHGVHRNGQRDYFSGYRLDRDECSIESTRGPDVAKIRLSVVSRDNELRL